MNPLNSDANPLNSEQDFWLIFVTRLLNDKKKKNVLSFLILENVFFLNPQNYFLLCFKM